VRRRPHEARTATRRPDPLVVIGDSSGIGLETAVRARQEGADVILTARTTRIVCTASAWSSEPSIAPFAFALRRAGSLPDGGRAG
jgi:NADP-dependent 3-hydroxy acid dehydrogenase YdfG